MLDKKVSMSIVIRRGLPTTQRNALFCFTATLMAALAYTPMKDSMDAHQPESMGIYRQSKNSIHLHHKYSIQPDKLSSRTIYIQALITPSNFIPFFSRSDFPQNISSIDANNEKSSEKLTDSIYLSENNELDSQTLEQISVLSYEMYKPLVPSSSEELYIAQVFDHKWDSTFKNKDCNCNAIFIAQQPTKNTSNQIQNGLCNIAATIVIGKENGSDILQTGNYNKALIKQVGIEQDLIQLQLGDLNLTDDWQEGSTNRIHVIQGGELNYHFSTQYGTGNELRVIQSK